MTDLIQKAKDYANRWLNLVKDLALEHKTDPVSEYCRIQQAYISGYNEAKATENGIQWHDLRKDLNDLPKNRHNVWITYINAYYQKVTTEASFRHKFWVIGGHKTECEVIAWCEIPQFKE